MRVTSIGGNVVTVEGDNLQALNASRQLRPAVLALLRESIPDADMTGTGKPSFIRNGKRAMFCFNSRARGI